MHLHVAAYHGNVQSAIRLALCAYVSMPGYACAACLHTCTCRVPVYLSCVCVCVCACVTVVCVCVCVCVCVHPGYVCIVGVYKFGHVNLHTCMCRVYVCVVCLYVLTGITRMQVTCACVSCVFLCVCVCVCMRRVSVRVGRRQVLRPCKCRVPACVPVCVYVLCVCVRLFLCWYVLVWPACRMNLHWSQCQAKSVAWTNRVISPGAYTAHICVSCLSWYHELL